KLYLTFKQPVAKPVLAGKTAVCIGDTLSLQASSPMPGVIWNWMTPTGTLTNNDSLLTVNAVTQTDTGLYRVVALLDGCTSEEDSVRVIIRPIVTPSVMVTADKINPGPWTPIQFSATAITNAGSAASYQWTKNGADIPGATAATYSATTAIDVESGDLICLNL